MKKFFSLLCAVAIVLSANAAPQLSKQLAAQKAERAFVENSRAEKKAAPAKKVTFSKRLKNAHSMPATKMVAAQKSAAPARAPKAQKAEQDITINEVGFQNYGGGDLFYALKNADYRFDFDILETNTAAEDVELGKTYTLPDMDTDYSYGRVLATDEYFEYASASFTKTLTDDSRVKIEAEVTDAEGNVYRLHYEEQPVLPGNFDITIGQVDSKYYSDDNDVYYKLISSDNLCTLTFDIILEEGAESQDVVLGQEYTISNMISQYTIVRYNGVADNLVEASFTKTVDDENLVHISGTAKDSHDRVFNFAYDEVPFVPTGDTIRHDFTATSKLSYLASYGEWSLRAADNTFELALDYYSSDAESPVGSFSEADFDITYCHVDSILSAENSSRKGIISGSLEVTSSNDTTFLFASLLCDDGNVYEFNAFFAVPVKQGEASIAATNLALDDSWYSYFGIIWAEASNDDYTVSLTLNAATGTLQAGTDFSGSIKNNATGVETEIYSGSITITNDGGIKIAGSVLCFDNIEYTLDLQYVLPEAKSQETITGAGRLYLGESQGSKYWQAAALNADQSRYVSLLAFADDPAGSYAMADLYASYTYVGKFAAPADTTWYNVLDANISVAVNGENATITGTLLGQAEKDEADVVEFTINLSLEIVDETGGGEEGNQYDAKDQAFKHMFAEYEVNTQYLAEDHVIYVSAKDAENNSIRLEFNMAADATELTPGVYPINDTYAANTVSVGAFEGQSLYGSIAGSVDDEGYYNIPLWFLAAGEVNVLENGVIQVSATNTWGAQIHCQLGSWPEAIDNTSVDLKATKAIRNGKLLIIKNGVEYNAQGAIVK